MKVIEETVDYLLSNFETLPDGELGAIESIESQLKPGSYELFMNPGIDTGEHYDISRTPRDNILGEYFKMQSPGILILHKKNLKIFFDTLLVEVMSVIRHITERDLSAAAKLIVSKTYYHEQFHFDCNVLQILFGSQQDGYKEEALATAWSRLKISEDRKNWQSTIGKMNGVVYNLLMKFAYAYRSPGYRDWPKFSDEVSFKNGLEEYINPKGSKVLMGNGVNVPDLLYAMIGKGKCNQGYVEFAV